MSFLPHGREIIQFLPLSDLYTEYYDHERLKVFAQKGLDCVNCTRRGAFLVLSQQTSRSKESRKKKTVGSVHLDVYTDDFVLMTVDHIIPKAICKEFNWPKAEIESIKNKQPMCDPCNQKKGHKLISYQEQIVRREAQKRTGTGAIWDLIPNIHALLGDKI